VKIYQFVKKTFDNAYLDQIQFDSISLCELDLFHFQRQKERAKIMVDDSDRVSMRQAKQLENSDALIQI
jgi:hypothetical protein